MGLSVVFIYMFRLCEVVTAKLWGRLQDYVFNGKETTVPPLLFSLSIVRKENRGFVTPAVDIFGLHY